MKRTMFKRSILLIGAVLFAVSFATASVFAEQETSPEPTAQTATLSGHITAIDPDAGTLQLSDESGETVIVKGSPGMLKKHSAGEAVSITLDPDGNVVEIEGAPHQERTP